MFEKDGWKAGHLAVTITDGRKLAKSPNKMRSFSVIRMYKMPTVMFPLPATKESRLFVQIVHYCRQIRTQRKGVIFHYFCKDCMGL